MFVLLIIGLLLRVYPGCCYKADVADVTRSQETSSQFSYYNREPRPNSQISSYNYGTSRNSNLNNDPSRNSNLNNHPSQNSNLNSDPSQNSNLNSDPSQNSYLNNDPSQNGNLNNDPSQNANLNSFPSQNGNLNSDPSQNGNLNSVPSQNSNLNSVPSQNGNSNSDPSQNGNLNSVPSQNSNLNSVPSQNSNLNSVPSQNGNLNSVPSQNGNLNSDPSQNGNLNSVPSQNSNLNTDHNQSTNHNYGPGLSSYNHDPCENSNFNNDPSRTCNYNYKSRQNSNVNNDPSQNSNFNNDPIQSSHYNYGHNHYHHPSQNSKLNDRSIKIRIWAMEWPMRQIGGTPAPKFTEYPNVFPDTRSRPYHEGLPISGQRGSIGGSAAPKFTEYPNVFIDTRSRPYHEKQQGVFTRGQIGGTPVPEFTEYPKVLLDTKSHPHNEKLVGNRHSDPDKPETEERQWFLWQVSVFIKEESLYGRLCGGTLVTSSAVISAALCFWRDGPEPEASFAVGAGEVASGQAYNYEAYQYQRNLRDIRLPPRFRGAASNYQDDLAVVVLARPLPTALRPICVSFDWELDEKQLTEGREGTVLDVELRMQRVPYVGPEECLRRTPKHQLEYITSDKICVGLPATSPTVCTSDMGSGLVYQDYNSIPYLRGVASVSLWAPCSTMFTHVGTHRAFLVRHVRGLEAECARHYPGAGGAVRNTGGGDEFVCNCYC